jgi:hypothetical protein
VLGVKNQARLLRHFCALREGDTVRMKVIPWQ